MELLASYVVGSDGDNAATLTTPTFTPNPGELIVAKMGNSDDDNPTCTGVSGGGLTWQKKIEHLPGIGNFSDAIIYTGVVGGSPAAMAVSSTWSGAQEGTGEHGMIVERWLNAMVAAVPARNGVKTGSGAPSSLITTTQLGSAVSWVNVDWNATNGTPAARGVDGQIVREFSPGGNYLAPFVSSRATGQQATDSTLHAVTLPADRRAGDMLLVFFSSDADTAASLTPEASANGWQVLGTLAYSTALRQTVVWKIADGTDGCGFTTPTAEQSTHVALAVPNGQSVQAAQSSGDGAGGGGGTIPATATITGRTTGINQTAATSHAVSLPSGVQAGEAALVFFTNDVATVTATTSSSGWTSLGTEQQGSTTNHRATVFYAANAATAASLVVNLSSSEEAAWAAFRVSGAATPVVASVAGGGSGTGITPAPLSGLGGGATYPTFVQSTTVTTSPGGTSAPGTLSTPATAGNLLVYTLAGDKNTGTLTLSDNIGGAWTKPIQVTGASVSTYVAYKVATGGETTISGSLASSSSSGNRGWITELTQTGGGTWSLLGSATPTYSDTAATSRATGSTGTLAANGVAIAVGTLDTIPTSGFSTSWTNSYAARYSSTGIDGPAGCFIADRTVDSGATTSTTFSFTGTTDQTHAAVVVFGKTGGGGGGTGNYTTLLLIAVDSSADTGLSQSVTWPGGWANTQARLPASAGTSTSPEVFTAEQRFTGVSSITPGNATLSVSEQWLEFTVAFPDGTTTTAGGGAADTPSVTTEGGGLNRLVVSALAVDTSATAAAGQTLAAPSGFGTVTRSNGAGSATAFTATAETTSTSTTVDPGGWTYTAAEEFVSATVAVTGGTGGGGGALRMYAGINYDEFQLQPAGQRTIGMTSPTGQSWTLVGIELLPAPVAVTLGVVEEVQEAPAVAAGRQFFLGLPVDELEELPPLEVYKLVAGPLLDTVEEVEDLPSLTVHKVLPPLGVVEDVEQFDTPITVSRLVLLGAPPEDVEEVPDLFAGGTALAAVREVEEVPALTVGFGGVDTARSRPRRGLPPVLYRGGVRVMAQNIITGGWVHRELPVSGLQLTRTLSGPQVITGTFTTEIADLRDLALEPWGTWIHLEEAGEIRGSGILLPGSYDDQGQLELTAHGPSAYIARVPYTGEFRAIQMDPAEIVRTLWAQVQSFPRGNLGVSVLGSTPVRVGTAESSTVVDPDIAARRAAARYVVQHWDGGGAVFEDLTYTGAPDVVKQRNEELLDLHETEQAEYPDVIEWLRHYYTSTSDVVEVKGEPWQLHGYELPLVGKVIDQLGTDTPFEWLEEQGWETPDKEAVWHRIRIGYPTVGSRLDLNLTQGENLLEHAPFEEPDDAYADSVFVQGKGEGADAVTGYAGVDVPVRLRLPRVLTDKTLATEGAATARAHEAIAAALASVEEVPEVAVNVRHENSLWGTFDVGDEVLPRIRLPWLGTFAQWHRIVQLTYAPDMGYATLALSRRDAFRSR